MYKHGFACGAPWAGTAGCCPDSQGAGLGDARTPPCQDPAQLCPGQSIATHLPWPAAVRPTCARHRLRRPGGRRWTCCTCTTQPRHRGPRGRRSCCTGCTTPLCGWSMLARTAPSALTAWPPGAASGGALRAHVMTLWMQQAHQALCWCPRTAQGLGQILCVCGPVTGLTLACSA